jgi:hypothetical protein
MLLLYYYLVTDVTDVTRLLQGVSTFLLEKIFFAMGFVIFAQSAHHQPSSRRVRRKLGQRIDGSRYRDQRGPIDVSSQ